MNNITHGLLRDAWNKRIPADRASRIIRELGGDATAEQVDAYYAGREDALTAVIDAVEAE